MICLDTNYLILALIPQTKEAMAVERWLEADESLGIPSVAWYEFLSGSTKEEEEVAVALLGGGSCHSENSKHKSLPPDSAP